MKSLMFIVNLVVKVSSALQNITIQMSFHKNCGGFELLDGE